MPGPENSNAEPPKGVETQQSVLNKPLDGTKGDYVAGMQKYMEAVLDKSAMCLNNAPKLSDYAPGELDKELEGKPTTESGTYAPGELERELKPSGIVPVDANNPD